MYSCLTFYYTVTQDCLVIPYMNSWWENERAFAIQISPVANLSSRIWPPAGAALISLIQLLYVIIAILQIRPASPHHVCTVGRPTLLFISGRWRYLHWKPLSADSGIWLIILFILWENLLFFSLTRHFNFKKMRMRGEMRNLYLISLNSTKYFILIFKFKFYIFSLIPPPPFFIIFKF